MTIESASHPKDLSRWDGEDGDPFYFEVFGETSPVLDVAYAEVIPPGAVEGGTQTTQTTPVYEYWWTIGHPGHRPEHSGLLKHIKGPDDLWARLPDPAARVYVYFPMGGGWRIKEMAATVKYMSPVAHEQSFWEKAAQDWQAVQPLADDASKLASSASPVAGAAASGSIKLLGAMAQLKLSSVPPVKGFEWSAGKVAFGNKDHGGVAQGVMWTLPASMFRELGGRLTGSLAVSFIPDRRQPPDTVSAVTPQPEPRALLAHAVVYSPEGHEHDHWAPTDRSFVHLRLAPRLPDGSSVRDT
ncbi:MAG: hypothetical protein WB698_04805 [Solirubrobacteraceae bacterium]